MTKVTKDCFTLEMMIIYNLIFYMWVKNHSKIDIVCLPMIDSEEGVYNEDTYINRVLKEFPYLKTKEINKVGSLLSSACSKIYSSYLLMILCILRKI